MTLLNSLLHSTAYRSPLLRTLIPSVGLAFALQTAFAIPSITLQTDRVYDLSGSITYLGVTALSLYLPALRARAAAGITGKLGAANGLPSLWNALRGAENGALGWNWRQLALSAAVGVWAVRCASSLQTPQNTNMMSNYS